MKKTAAILMIFAFLCLSAACRDTENKVSSMPVQEAVTSAVSSDSVAIQYDIAAEGEGTFIPCPILDDGTGPIRFGMTDDEFIEFAKGQNWSLDVRSWNGVATEILPKCNGRSQGVYSFTDDGVLYKLESYFPQEDENLAHPPIATQAGLQEGDTRKQMEEKYPLIRPTGTAENTEVFKFYPTETIMLTVMSDLGSETINNWRLYDLTIGSVERLEGWEDFDKFPTWKAPVGAFEKTPVGDDGTGVFSLGMTWEVFEKTVSDKHWILEKSEPSKDGRVFCVVYSGALCEGLYTFDKDGRLASFESLSEAGLQSTRGLSVGGTLKSVQTLYPELQKKGSEEGVDTYVCAPNGSVELTVYIKENQSKVLSFLVERTGGVGR